METLRELFLSRQVKRLTYCWKDSHDINWRIEINTSSYAKMETEQKLSEVLRQKTPGN